MIALIVELRDGQLAVGPAGISRGEHEIAGLGTVRAPAQVVGRRRGLAVLVRAQHADVKVVTREIEIVRITAELRDRVFGREDQAHVGVALVVVQVVHAAVIEWDDVATNARIGSAALLQLRFHAAQRDIRLVAGLAR